MDYRDVYVIGVAMTKIYKKAPVTVDELGRQAIYAAVKDAGISPKEIQTIFIGEMGGLSGSVCIGQRICGTLGLGGVPMANVESACSSGAIAVHQAYKDVATGRCDVAMGIGVQHLSSSRAGGTGLAPDPRDPEGIQGATMAGIYAMRAQRYLHEFDATPADLALVSVKNRRHAALNPYSSYQQPITVEEVLNARIIADPLTMLMCCPNADGGAAVIVATKEKAQQLGSKLVRIAASSLTSGIFRNDFRDMTEMEITIRCSQKSYDMAGLGPDDIDMVECHDAFAIGEFLYYESMGFCKHGEAAQFIRSGGPDYGGKVVFSPRGGLLSCGHPTGCTGAAQIVEATWQLRGDAGARQVPDCKAAITHVTGGGVYGLDNAACTMHILTR